MTITVPGWLSKLPQDWTVEKAGYRIYMSVGGTPPTSQPELFDGEVPWLTIADMDSQVITDCEKRISEEGRIIAGASWANPGDLLYSFKLSIGKTAFVGAPLVTNEAIATIRRSSKIDLGYARWMLPLAFDANASTNIYGAKLLNQEQLRSARMPVPPSGQQRLIADFLDRETTEIDAFIADLEDLVSTNAERWSSTRNAAVFAVPDSVTGRASSWFPEFRNGHPETKFKRLFDVTLGKMLDEKQHRGSADARFDYVRAGNIRDGWIDFSDINQMPFDPREQAKYSLLQGDLLVVEGGSVGTNVVLKEALPGVFFQKTVNRARSRGEADPDYFSHVLNAYKERGVFEVIGGKSTIMHLTAEKLGDLDVPAPPLSVQREVSAHLERQREAVTRLATDVEQAITLAQERRAALISAAVTGQIDVTERRKPAVEQLQDEIEETR